MKYFYRILRLFFCPHKYETIGISEVKPYNEDFVYKRIYRQECEYCGKPNVYKVQC
jgi:hypothetical protein